MKVQNSFCESVRVIILNYNTARYTIDLVSKIKNQIYTNFEIVVVDNNSKVSDYLYLVNHLDKDICLIKSVSNLGYSAGNNLGFKFDSINPIDYFLILNSDLIVDDIHLVEKLVVGFKLNSDKPIYASSPLVKSSHNNQPSHSQIQVRKLLSTGQLFFLSFSIFKKLFPSIFKKYIYFDAMPFNNKYLIADTINGAAFMISRKFLESINYLDENVFLYHEELILGKQIQNAGGVCVLNGYTEVTHLQGISTKSTPKSLILEMERHKYFSEAYFFEEYLHINKFFVKVFCFLKELELLFKKWILFR